MDYLVPSLLIAYSLGISGYGIVQQMYGGSSSKQSAPQPAPAEAAPAAPVAPPAAEEKPEPKEEAAAPAAANAGNAPQRFRPQPPKGVAENMFAQPNVANFPDFLAAAADDDDDDADAADDDDNASRYKKNVNSNSRKYKNVNVKRPQNVADIDDIFGPSSSKNAWAKPSRRQSQSASSRSQTRKGLDDSFFM